MEENKWVAGAISPLWVEFYTYLKLQGAVWKTKNICLLLKPKSKLSHHVWQQIQAYEFSLDLLRLVGIEKMLQNLVAATFCKHAGDTQQRDSKRGPY